MVDNIHSTGRGGAGNIGPDDSVYTDGGIVREGVVGESHNPEYSAGRGGAGNIVDSPKVRPQQGRGNPSSDIIPETAMRGPEGYENFHTGRGGQGNVYKDKYGGHSTAQEQKAAQEQKKNGEKKEGLGGKLKDLFSK